MTSDRNALANYYAQRQRRTEELAAGKISMRKFLTERIHIMRTPFVRGLMVPEFFKLYNGNHSILVAWLETYLGLPADWPRERRRYWRTRLFLECESLAGHRGLLHYTLLRAGQDLEAASVLAMMEGRFEGEAMYTRGHAAGVTYERAPGGANEDETGYVVEEVSE